MMYDIAVIGGGAAGLSAAVYAQRAMLKTVVVEQEYMGTGQIAESHRVDNYPDFFGIAGAELGDSFRNHAEALGTEFINDKAVNITPLENKNGYRIGLSEGETMETKTVVFAPGCKRKALGIKGEREFSGRGVSFCAVCDGAFYKGKTAAVIGAGDTAFSDALYLANIASKVYIIARRDKFRAGNSLVNAAKKCGNIEIITGAVPLEIMGKRSVNGILVNADGMEKFLAASGVFIAAGSIPNTSLLSGIAELDEGGYVIADESGITSAAGIFAAGDVRTKQLRQVITAAADGANCVISAEKYISENFRDREEVL